MLALPLPLLTLLLATITPISAYAIVEPLAQPTPTQTLNARQNQATVQNLAASSISASFASQLALQTAAVQSLQQVVQNLEFNLAETRRGLSLAQAQVVSVQASANAATRVNLGAAVPTTTGYGDGKPWALPDMDGCPVSFQLRSTVTEINELMKV